MIFFIGILHLPSGGMSGFDEWKMGVAGRMKMLHRSN
jgi:hypothetical protein